MSACIPLLAAVVLLLTPLALTAQTAEETARQAFQDDVHASAGLTCASCHPGSSSGQLSMPRVEVAPRCAKCHSDAAYMRQFDPQVRIDQYAQYLTSVHGKRMARGDVRVATCSDCHGGHGIRRVRDARSPVAPAHVAPTCGRCHADAARMAAFNREAKPFADWSGSVHAEALLKRGDSSAPTCSTCHGSHGATPPGVTEIANVCAQCHVREAELFRASPKKAIFDQIGQPECLTCHGNHRIEHPMDAWVGLKDPAVCAMCHDERVKGADTITGIESGFRELNGSLDLAQAVLERAERAGMLVDDGWTALRESREQLIHSRVIVHAFATKPFDDITRPGLVAACRADSVGRDALRELQTRRRGLGIATVVALGFLATLWLKIRRVHAEQPPREGP